MPITGGTLNGLVMTDLVADKQRIEAKLQEYVFLEEVTLASQAAGTIGVGFIPLGSRIVSIRTNSDTSLGTTTIAFGITGAAAKYRVAAVATAINQWVENALNAAVGLPTTADEEILMTTAVAALPASGRLLIEIRFLAP